MVLGGGLEPCSGGRRPERCWAAVAFALIAAGDYGASGVFRILEPYLTARLPAEALCITALACQVRGRKWLGLALAVGALAIHPLMALPGLLLLGSLWVPPRVVVTAAIGGVLATLSSRSLQSTYRELRMFLPSWMILGWMWCGSVRSFFFCNSGRRAIGPSTRSHSSAWDSQRLLFGAIGYDDSALGLHCWSCRPGRGVDRRSDRPGGNTGAGPSLAVGVGCCPSSELLLPLTALKVGRDEKCGPLCALLLVFGWTLPGIDGTACIGLASIIWLARPVISSRGSRYCRWAFTALIIAIGMWIFIQCRNIWSPPSASAGPAPSLRRSYGKCSPSKCQPCCYAR